MSNRIPVTIAGQELTLVSQETDQYVQTVAAYVDSKISEMLGQGLSLSMAAILSAANIADELFRSNGTAENLRSQIKQCLDESAKLKSELSEAKREIFKLTNK